MLVWEHYMHQEAQGPGRCLLQVKTTCTQVQPLSDTDNDNWYSETAITIHKM